MKHLKKFNEEFFFEHDIESDRADLGDTIIGLLEEFCKKHNLTGDAAEKEMVDTLDLLKQSMIESAEDEKSINNK